MQTDLKNLSGIAITLTIAVVFIAVGSMVLTNLAPQTYKETTVRNELQSPTSQNISISSTVAQTVNNVGNSLVADSETVKVTAFETITTNETTNSTGTIPEYVNATNYPVVNATEKLYLYDNQTDTDYLLTASNYTLTPSTGTILVSNNWSDLINCTRDQYKLAYTYREYDNSTLAKGDNYTVTYQDGRFNLTRAWKYNSSEGDYLVFAYDYNDDSHATTLTSKGNDSLGTFSDWFELIVIVAIAVIILSLVFMIKSGMGGRTGV